MKIFIYGGKVWVGKPNTAVTGLTEGEYEFAEDGKMIGRIVKNGPVGDYFYINDVRQNAYQLVEFEDNYYFIYDGHKIAKNCTLYLTAEFVEGTGLKAGKYDFDADGKLVIKNGPVGDYFYINGVMQKAYQLVNYEGDYYYISDAHKIAKNCTLYLTEQFIGDTGFTPGKYDFDADGKMVIKNGPVGDYFYINNVRQNAYQVVEYEGNYYFISDGHKIAKNRKLYVLDVYLVKYGIPAATYTFDSTGKMILKNGPVGNKFYINSVQQNAYQLVQYEGNYYFIGDGHLLVMDTTIYLTKEYVYGTGLAAGKYYFDTTGKLVIE